MALEEPSSFKFMRDDRYLGWIVTCVESEAKKREEHVLV